MTAWCGCPTFVDGYDAGVSRASYRTTGGELVEGAIEDLTPLTHSVWLRLDDGHRVLVGGHGAADEFRWSRNPAAGRRLIPTRARLTARCVLPLGLWWAIPLGVVAYVVQRHRLSPWAWPVLAAILAYPPTITSVVYGNPGIWIAAFVAAGTVWRWPAALGVLSIALLPLWLDWLRVVLNARGNVTYSLAQIPLLALPIVAYVARRSDACNESRWPR